MTEDDAAGDPASARAGLCARQVSQPGT